MRKSPWPGGLAGRVEGTGPTLDGPAGLGRRLRGGGRVRWDAVRRRDRTVHLTAVDLTHPLQEA